MVATYDTTAFASPTGPTGNLGPVGDFFCMEASMTPLTIQLDALPAALTDCVALYRKVGQLADDCRGAILRHIRDDRLYKQSGCKTFEAFVDAEFGLSLRRANQLIEAFAVTHNLDGKNFSQMPASESQARTLAKLPADEQAGAWEEVVAEAEESGEKITARKVEKVVAKRIAKKIKPNPSVTLAEAEMLRSDTLTLILDLNNARSSAEFIARNCDAKYVRQLVGFLESHLLKG